MALPALSNTKAAPTKTTTTTRKPNSTTKTSLKNTTPKPTTSTSKTNNGKTTSTGSTKKNLPSFTTSTSISSSSSSASSSLSYTTPAVSVPVSSNNPYISRSTSPSGTVFICFGAIAVFIMIATFCAYLFNSWRARRVTLNKEINYGNEYKGDYNYVSDSNGIPLLSEELGLSNSHNHLHHLSINTTTSNNNINDDQYSTPYHVHQPSLVNPTDVTRMFISPTAEVLNVRNKTNFNMVEPEHSPIRSNRSPLRRSSLESQTLLNQYGHNRNNSSFNVSNSKDRLNIAMDGDYSSSPTSGKRETRGRRGRSGVIPSLVLDDILKDEKFDDHTL